MSRPTIKSLTKKGYSQKKIAKTLGIRKMKVVTYQKAHKIGKRAPSVFWSDVKAVKRMREVTHKEATGMVYNDPFWARRRAVRQAKQYKSYSEFWKEWREKWKDATEAEREKHTYEATYGDDGSYIGGTPH